MKSNLNKAAIKINSFRFSQYGSILLAKVQEYNSKHGFCQLTLSRQVALHCATLKGLPTSCSPPIKIAIEDDKLAKHNTVCQKSAIFFFVF